MHGKKQDHSRRAIFLVMLWIFLPVIVHSQEIQHKTLSDGVEHWYRIKQEKPWFFKQFEKISEVIVNRKPFGKSVAFLVGVSEYKNLPKLPFVKNDLDALRKFLLTKGGFDEVYVAADQVVTTRLVQGYMRNNPMKLEAEDRLLFYYSGHGADLNGKTGYMQFSEAEPDRFDSEKYLQIKECTEWSSSLKFKHILFIYDCCVSGLAFTAKAGESDRDERISATLKKMSDTGSRTVITAGTSEEKSFGVGDHSVFTEAFLKAFDNCPNTGGFITTDEIFSQIKRRVRDFCLGNDKQLTPRHWELEDHKYRGTFLFVDTSAKNISLSEDVVKGLGIEKDGEVSRAEVAPPKTEPKPVEEVQKEKPAPQVQKSKPDTGKSFTNSLGMKFVPIPAGTFIMGSPPNEPGERFDSQTQHKVTLTKGFYMQVTEVTQGQWKAMMGNNPSGFKICGENCPVENVSWNDVQEFIKRLNQKEKIRKYRLPTEAEWEYAARAGSSTTYYFGDDVNELDQYAWYKDNSGGKTHPVGELKPNSWGLYDMYGNVSEWCQDWFGTYPYNDIVDPTGPNTGSYRVNRSGCWDVPSTRCCRSAKRSCDSPDTGYVCIGFRLVCE